MIRPATREDIPAAVDLAIAAELFGADDADPVRDLLQGFFDGSPEGHGCLVDDDDAGTPAGVAYYGPKPAADRVWDLTMIAIRPALQGHGRGRALIGAVEARLTTAGARLLLVETSGLARFDLTRRFYVRCGYGEVARVPDYWARGDDLVLFRKAL